MCEFRSSRTILIQRTRPLWDRWCATSPCPRWWALLGEGPAVCSSGPTLCSPPRNFTKLWMSLSQPGAAPEQYARLIDLSLLVHIHTRSDVHQHVRN